MVACGLNALEPRRSALRKLPALGDVAEAVEFLLGDRSASISRGRQSTPKPAYFACRATLPTILFGTADLLGLADLAGNRGAVAAVCFA
jgi:hypothetical protein